MTLFEIALYNLFSRLKRCLFILLDDSNHRGRGAKNLIFRAQKYLLFLAGSLSDLLENGEFE